jgi:hypothetical protein
MIDNLSKVLPFLHFDTPDDFYYLQLLQRKKENPQLGSNSRVIRSYYIKSQQYLLDRYDEIKALCDSTNARAMIRLNKRSFEKVGFQALENVANTMKNREYKFLMKSYDRACGLGHNDPIKKWIVDIDCNSGESVLPAVIEHINNIEPAGIKVIETIPSKNGFHLITTAFNTQVFREKFSYIELHKDNPTNLYIP